MNVNWILNIIAISLATVGGILLLFLVISYYVINKGKNEKINKYNMSDNECYDDEYVETQEMKDYIYAKAFINKDVLTDDKRIIRVNECFYDNTIKKIIYKGNPLTYENGTYCFLEDINPKNIVEVPIDKIVKVFDECQESKAVFLHYAAQHAKYVKILCEFKYDDERFYKDKIYIIFSDPTRDDNYSDSIAYEIIKKNGDTAYLSSRIPNYRKKLYRELFYDEILDEVFGNLRNFELVSYKTN